MKNISSFCPGFIYATDKKEVITGMLLVNYVLARKAKTASGIFSEK